MPRRAPRADDSGAQLRAWLTERERELVTRSLTPVGYHQGKRIVPPPVPPTLDEVDAAVADESNIWAWSIGHGLRTLAAGERYGLDRRDLPDWHQERYVGAFSDALVLTENNDLLDERR